MVAFGVSRRTLYGWKKAYRDTQGNTAGLNNKSRAPIDRRKRQDWELALLEHLLRLRRRHPALDFEKRHIFLLD